MDHDLRPAWADLLRRRPALAGTLGVYGDVLDLWAQRSVLAAPLDLDADACRSRWGRGVPLVAECPPALARDAVEPLLAPALDLAAGVRPDAAPAIDTFGEGWDRGAIGPGALLRAARGGARDDGLGDVDDALVAFLGVVSLRPLLEPAFEPCRRHLGDAAWSLGLCPFCGAPPAWGDITEGGRLELACHLCGGGWAFGRLRCPFCGTDETKALGRLTAERGEDGYAIATCASCRGYLKVVDRRERWDAGPALLEDWASPHLDVTARRRGFARPLLPLVLSAPAQRVTSAA